jgi:hypothetical protein
VADIVERAHELVERVERGDIEGARDLLTPKLRSWPGFASYLDEAWGPALDELAGAARRITDSGTRHDDRVVRVGIAGDAGTTSIGVAFDDDDLISHFVVGVPPDGIATIVIGCPRGVWRNDRVEGEPRALAGFYADLLGMRIIRNDWIKIARDLRTRPALAFGRDGWTDERAPRWPDPAYPQQLHLDLLVPDLDAADGRVLALGARPLQDRGSFRSYADPVGHPFCLYEDESVAAPAELGRIVFDCPEPGALAGFYVGLLGLTVLDRSPDRVVIGAAGGRRPALAFQRSEGEPPRWPDPRYPAQLHLDIYFDDGAGAEVRAADLGATRLPEKGGSAPVFADPAGHPFCLLSTRRG